MQRDMLDPSLDNELWTDLVLPHQLPPDMYQSMQVSRAWNVFFKQPTTWKNALSAHFKIAHSVLSQFETIVFNFTGLDTIDYQLMYHRMHALHHTKVHRYYMGLRQEFLANPTFHLPLLACCLDNVVVATRLLRKDLSQIWCIAVLCTGSVNVFTTLFQQGKLDNYISHDTTAAITQHFIETTLPLLESYPKKQFVDIMLVTYPFRHIKNVIENATRYNLDVYNNKLIHALIMNEKVPLSFIYDLLLNKEVIATQPLENFFFSLFHNKKNREEVENKIIQFLWENNIKFTKKLKILDIEGLIENGYFEYVKYLLENDMLMLPLENRFLVVLSKAGCLTKTPLSYWFDQRQPWALQQTEELLRCLIGYKEVDLFLRLLTPGNGYQFTLSKQTFIDAAESLNPQFLRFLLDNYVTPTYKPDQYLLDRAVSRGHVENVRALLNPVYELIPTIDHLIYAIRSNQLEMVKLFLDEERQFGLTVTPEMLYETCQSRPFKGEILQPVIEIVKIMLQPRFGLKITQPFFDSLYDPAKIYADNHPRSENSTDMILFLLDNDDVKLTQERYESLFCGANMTGIGCFPTAYPERFSYLKPTNKMLNKAINRCNEDYVVYFLEDRFKLEVGADSLDLALTSGNKSIQRAVFERCDAAPSMEQIARINDMEFLRDVFAKYAIDIADYLPLGLASCCYMEKLMFVLDLAVKSNLLGPKRPYCHEGGYLTSFDGGMVLLDPKYNIQFNRHKAGEIVGFYPAIESFLLSDFVIKACLAKLRVGNQDEAFTQFKEAFNLSQYQCFRVATFALSHPEQYQLDDQACKRLFDLIATGVNSVGTLTVVEHIEIQRFLTTAYYGLMDRGQKQMAEALPVGKVKELVDRVLGSRGQAAGCRR